MIALFALLLLSVSFGNVIEVRDTNVVATEIGEYYFDYNQRIYKIDEQSGFEIKTGRASLSFDDDEIEDSIVVTLLDYKKLEKVKIKESNLRGDYKIPRTFDKKVNASMIRYLFKDGSCMTMEVARNQLHFLNLQLKLMSGYRTEYDEVNSFITQTCIDINNTCWAEHYTAADCAYKEAMRLEPSLKGRKFATTIHYFEKHYS